ncbi:hypothetical protein GN956_G22684 [Arapaima gigas]
MRRTCCSAVLTGPISAVTCSMFQSGENPAKGCGRGGSPGSPQNTRSSEDTGCRVSAADVPDRSTLGNVLINAFQRGK